MDRSGHVSKCLDPLLAAAVRSKAGMGLTDGRTDGQRAMRNA